MPNCNWSIWLNRVRVVSLNSHWILWELNILSKISENQNYISDRINPRTVQERTTFFNRHPTVIFHNKLPTNSISISLSYPPLNWNNAETVKTSGLDKMLNVGIDRFCSNLRRKVSFPPVKSGRGTRTWCATQLWKEGARAAGETVLKLPANRHKLSRFLKTPKKVTHLMKQQTIAADEGARDVSPVEKRWLSLRLGGWK